MEKFVHLYWPKIPYKELLYLDWQSPKDKVQKYMQTRLSLLSYRNGHTITWKRTSVVSEVNTSQE